MDAVQELLPDIDFVLGLIRDNFMATVGVVLVFSLLILSFLIYHIFSFCPRKASRRSSWPMILHSQLNYSWYHGCISDAKAVDRLKEGSKKRNGVYLVYRSILCPDECILLVCYNGQSLEWTISKTPDKKYELRPGNGLRVTKKRTVEELIKLYQGEDGNTLESPEGKTLKLSETFVPNDIDLLVKLWYHGNISNEIAENQLKIVSSDKTDGKYLIYKPSDSYLPDQYRLLVYSFGNFLRLRISKVRDDKFILGDNHGPDVCGYKTLDKLIDAQKKVRTSLIKSDQGHLVVLKSHVSKSDILWYHGPIDWDTAKDRLTNCDNKTNGAYLVYSNSNNLSEYVLSLRYNRSLHRWKILKAPDNMYVLGKDAPDIPRHSTVEDLIKYHRGVTGTPIRLDKNNVVTLSRSYVERPS